MTGSDPFSWQRGDVQFVAGLVAYLLFALSAGVYAGTEGRVRSAALGVGLVAEVACALLLVAHVRLGVGRRREQRLVPAAGRRT
jgi:hypothetical protein